MRSRTAIALCGGALASLAGLACDPRLASAEERWGPLGRPSDWWPPLAAASSASDLG